MINFFFKILELLGDRLEVCVSVYPYANLTWPISLDTGTITYNHHV